MINKVKGTYDLLPSDIYIWQYLEKFIKELYQKYNYKEIRTPIFEYSNLFHRDNEHSDMVTKETYNFKDKGNRDLTLRPEGTAGVLRSYIENKLYANNRLVKLFYIGPNFRYERPQKGRFRQFMQFGVETLGSNDYLIDVEIIKLAFETVKQLGLKQYILKINTLGDKQSKTNFEKALVNYLTPFYNELSFDSKERLTKNPLRILDSKDPNDLKIIKNAPSLKDYLSDKSKESFENITKMLTSLKIDYEIDYKLVRGLDYYSDTVFEILSTNPNFGSQTALVGGGRYNSLVKELGGPEIPGIGFAFGMERLVESIKLEEISLPKEKTLDAYFITFDPKTKKEAFKLQALLRDNGFITDLNYLNSSFKSQLKEALSEEAKYLIIIGEDELNENKVTVKDTKLETQEKVKIDNLVSYLKEKLNV
ncbi:MAG: histidine--tRNA ligase [Acholeplasmataceae bacterium]